MARIERLTVENYRGASTRLQLDFESSKPIALVFGESGTGKTTIADALDALFERLPRGQEFHPRT